MKSPLSKKTLSRFGLDFHHLGLAVADPAPAQQFMKAMGYRLSSDVFDSLQKVNLIFCKHAHLPAMEIVYAKSSPNPIETYLEKTDSCLYHVCYKTKNVEKSIASLKENQIRVIRVSLPKPAILFGGKKVSFYFVKGFGLVELLEDPRG